MEPAIKIKDYSNLILYEVWEKTLYLKSTNMLSLSDAVCNNGKVFLKRSKYYRIHDIWFAYRSIE